MLFSFLLFIIFNWTNVSLHTEYEALHDRPVYYFAMRSGLGIFLSTIFSLLQAMFIFLGRRVLGIEKYSYRKIFIFHLIIFSILTILFVAFGFYSVLSSDPSDRVD